MSIYKIDEEIEKLENFIGIYAEDLDRLYLERELYQEDLSESSKINIFKLEFIITDYAEKLDNLYLHRDLILNKNAY